MVLAVTGLLTGLASVGFQSRLPQHRLAIAARDLVSDLRWARHLAVAERRSVSVVLDLEGDRYWIEREAFPGVPVGWVRNLRDAAQGFGGIDLLDSSGGPVITFHAPGSTHRWTTVTLQNDDGERRRITVVATGRVKLL